MIVWAYRPLSFQSRNKVASPVEPLNYPRAREAGSLRAEFWPERYLEKATLAQTGAFSATAPTARPLRPALLAARCGANPITTVVGPQTNVKWWPHESELESAGSFDFSRLFKAVVNH